MPNLIGLTKKEAKTTLKEIGLEIEIKENEENTDTKITEQLPKAGIKVKSGTTVIGYAN